MALPAESLYHPSPQRRTREALDIRWEKLPTDYELPDDPVENLEHPLLAAALREALALCGFITPKMLIATDFGLCVTVNQRVVLKAPDWVYVPAVNPVDIRRRSYTPHTEGDVPLVVMEFLSDRDNGEYSRQAVPPYGKWFFYEQILKVPYYVIFKPISGKLEVYHLNKNQRYQQQQPDKNQRYPIPAMQLSLGVWYGSQVDRTGYWLRWWNQQDELLLWGEEILCQERQTKEAALQQIQATARRAETAEQQVQALLAELHALKAKAQK